MSLSPQQKPQTEQAVVTVDVVLTARVHGELYLLLIERGKEPFKGQWVLPGGKLATCDETLEAAARRELQEETGMLVETLIQAHTYGRKGRDPRGRYVSVVYFAPTLTAPTLDAIQGLCAGDDAARAQWFKVGALPVLAFDHAHIIVQAWPLLHYVNSLEEIKR